MYKMINGFSDQIKVSIKYMDNWSLNNKYSNIENVLITGMGGSAIGGDFVAALLEKDCNQPIIINRSYNIPGWVNENTLVITSSYSGQTEETISALKQALDKNAKIICITTGGQISIIALKEKLDLIKMPLDLQPRAAIGFSLTLTFLILAKIGIFNYQLIKNNLVESIIELEKWQLVFQNIDENNPAIKISKKIKNTFPVIYAASGWTGICALRFRGQLAENSKILSSHYIFPEQNHNEIEGWTCYPNILSNTSIVWLNDLDNNIRVHKRMKITKELLSSYSSNQININVDGKSSLERMFKMIHLLDWVSYYLALLNSVDPTPVNRISQLKERLVDK